MTRGTLRSTAVGTVALYLWVLGMVGVAVADVVGPHHSNPYPDVGRMEAQLGQWERQLVAQWLQDYGYSLEQVEQWMAQVTDADIHEAILQAENLGLPYGGILSEAASLIYILAVAAVLVAIAIWLLKD